MNVTLIAPGRRYIRVLAGDQGATRPVAAVIRRPIVALAAAPTGR